MCLDRSRNYLRPVRVLYIGNRQHCLSKLHGESEDGICDAVRGKPAATAIDPPTLEKASISRSNSMEQRHQMCPARSHVRRMPAFISSPYLGLLKADSSLGERSAPPPHLEVCPDLDPMGCSGFHRCLPFLAVASRAAPRLTSFSGPRLSRPCSTPGIEGTVSASDSCSASAPRAARWGSAMAGNHHNVKPALPKGLHGLERIYAVPCASRDNLVAESHCFSTHRPGFHSSSPTTPSGTLDTPTL